MLTPKDLLPHRYPFLMIDKIISVRPMEYAECIKNVSYNENYFMGHFPENNIFPGVLMIEALAQTTAVMYAYPKSESLPVNVNKIGYLAKVKEMRFYGLVYPGDTLHLTSVYVGKFQNIIEASVTAKIDSRLVGKGTLVVTENAE